MSARRAKTLEAAEFEVARGAAAAADIQIATKSVTAEEIPEP
jgi:hypothetical protein